MKIKILQFPINLKTTEKNIETGLEFLESEIEGTDLVVMPEMWTCGLFHSIRDSFAIDKTDHVLGEILKLCRKFNSSVIPGTLPEISDDKIFNTAYFVNPDGISSESYRKIHLFKLGGEDKYSQPGKKISILKTDHGIISPLVCYDLRFPEVFRSLAMKGVQCFVIPAQWPGKRVLHWRSMLVSRAIENQAFIFASNLCGNDGNLDFAGLSMIVNPWGEIIESAGVSEKTSIEADIDIREVDEIREKFPFLKDSYYYDEISHLTD